ncbi:acetyl-CoA hydrolase/transferase family protein [Parasphingopyxis marina]|uniref:Acetyl-CoA hydrolase/transferase C-terminal domain-containing protein n=1 Tax=Parasphingopyxis marina TaxID=2761622 RepID=A0A842I205_9SPHN|nr:acetyl-CoA hydrolase/transferase C-terminal domain-containing protein [Parasphingopyxis marina]MBC2778977.1 hypothetical protein [Parasphingopyxis marina]
MTRFRPLTANRACALLRESDRLLLLGTSAEPRLLDRLVRDDPASVSHLSILTTCVAGINRFDGAALVNARDVTGFFPAPMLGDSYRQLLSTYFGITAQIASTAPDTVFVPTSLPDDKGYITSGLSAEFTETAMAVADRRIALLCPSMPRLPGCDPLHLDRFSHAFLDETPPLEIAESGRIDDPVALAIAGHVARLIGDGATIQVGIGKVPGRLFGMLRNRKRLRIHSGLVTGDIRDLVEAGSTDPEYPITCATVLGSAPFYAWLDGRSDFRLLPVDYTHNPATLARIDGLIAVNSALQVDLLGQANAEKIGDHFVSAPGGLPDFSSASHRSQGGCSIVALPSTDRSGALSRIVGRLDADTPVTVPRTDVDFVVTEHGIAELGGKSVEERARALVEIAAPFARNDLARCIA